MNRLLQFCPLKMFSKKMHHSSILLGQPTAFKTLLRGNQSEFIICQLRRKQSAKAALFKLVMKKAKKPSRRKITEVLEVNGNNSKFIETQVRRLNSSHIALEEHEDPSMLSCVESLDKEMNYESGNENIRAMLSQVNNKNKKAKKERDKSKIIDKTIQIINKKADEKMRLKQILEEREKLAKETILNETLLAYIDTCVNCDFLNRGLVTLKYYMTPKKLNKARIIDINIFNTLLHAYAAQGKLDKIKDIVDIIKQHDFLKPNLQTFAAQIECYGRNSTEECEQQLLDIEKQLKSLGYSLNDLFIHCDYTGDQRDTVLNAIHQVYPDFKLNVPLPNLKYNCDLLTELNDSDNRWKSPARSIISSNDIQDSVKEQLDTEIAGVVTVKSLNSIENEDHHKIEECRKLFNEAKEIWRNTITEAFERDLKIIRIQHNKLKTYRTVNIYTFLRVLPIEEITDIVLSEVVKLVQGSDYFSPTLPILYKNLGRQVYNKYSISKKIKTGILDKQIDLYEKYCDWYLNPNESELCRNTRHRWQLLVHEHHDGPSLNKHDIVWPNSVLSSIGKFLYGIIVKDIKININIMKRTKKHNECMLPAFYTLFRTGRHMNEELKPHPILTKLYRATHPETLDFDVVHCPMMSPPLPWSCVYKGGYVIADVPFIRLPVQAQQQLTKLRQMNQQQLYPAFDSLNQLSSTPWVVNEPVLNVISEVFLNGGSSKLDIPKPSSSFPLPPAVSHKMSRKERHEAFKERFVLKRQKSEMFSLWCDALYRLSLAHHFKGRIFWLPHNMDFRGRVYPCPPHLNHLGSDMARSMLRFAKKERLGPEGLNWLKIHCINLTGLKKRESTDERLRYANSIINDILDSAQNPLSGRMWWADSENPWQTLACCMEINKALEADNPEEYLTGFPVHQDGSCNGLQHYAALGRDHAGAVSVNLAPSERPHDVYSAVAALVERERTKEAQNGLKIAQVMDGFVRRKTIKQTVMTTVYGVTRYGARLQIAKQLKDLDAYPQEYVWSGSSYLMIKTFECLREMFTSTREIQDWFTDCAKFISIVKGKPVEWVTPLGLPVIQHYHKASKYASQTPKLSTVSGNIAGDMFNKPNMMKQKNAFPPNFVHSLDSTHMMLTSLHCENEGITYVSVHDCFWTHPATVHIMNRICRQQFVNLHSQPILEDLSLQLVNNYANSDSEMLEGSKKDQELKRKLNETLTKVPIKGDFNLKNVLRSVYFFS